ncbi:TniQ family protein [Pseudomonas protegens]
MKLLFHGLPTPGNDETLGSWLFRCSVNSRSRFSCRIHLGDRPSRWWDDMDLKYVDPDTEIPMAIARLKVAGFEVRPQALQAHFVMQSGRPVAWNYRRLYCPECLRENVAMGQLPMWKKSWCYEEASVCTVHGRYLEVLDDCTRYSKAWDAFVAHCNTMANRASKASPLLQRLQSTTMSIITSSFGDGNGSTQNGVHNLFCRLYRIFLQAPYKGSLGGIARVHFSTERSRRFIEPKNLEHSFLIGPSTADSTSRFGSAMLTGALLGIVSESRYSAFARIHAAASYNYLLPQDLHRAAKFPQLDKRGYVILHSLLGTISRTDYPLLDRHLHLQEEHYKHDGAFDGRPFGLESRQE